MKQNNVFTRSHACMFTCLHAYMRIRLQALAYMFARLYVFTCLHTPVLLHPYVLTCLLATIFFISTLKQGSCYAVLMMNKIMLYTQHINRKAVEKLPFNAQQTPPIVRIWDVLKSVFLVDWICPYKRGTPKIPGQHRTNAQRAHHRTNMKLGDTRKDHR